ncbi:sensor histidine kinase [Mucilaginibacter pedocola]|uniref:histidine kinase n=1 Tax=Mucilaginibacter pedocola TaxID=1792845 RepID=A0A1S9PKM9_9SPHI|nr:HAMP domain-containing protein [Mucilaginibacter pedocola]OOQ61522.1 hypothetical protein BC343_00115 [Mucilaginibacter pedocola]
MTWFQPSPGSITDLSIACIELVFLVYLLRLKNKSGDCYLMIFIYATALPAQLVSFFVGSVVNPPASLYWLMLFTEGLQFVAVIWCSYRFYQNSFPRESWVAILAYVFLFCCAAYFWLTDFYLFHRIALNHILFFAGLYVAATLWSAINYIRKMKLFLKERGVFSLKHELLHPTTRETALFSGFAFSLFIYTLIQAIIFLYDLDSVPPGFFLTSLYLLSVSITVLVGFAYFSYAREKTSFETKIVGITLFLTLSAVTLIPIVLFGADGTPETTGYVKVFVIIVPVTTLAICFLLPLLLRYTLLKHLNKIVAGVIQVGTGDLDAKVEVQVNDEIGRLSRHFNRMTGSLRERTEQLNSMRETIATDFHDQTGNMLSAITRQAGLLKLKLSSEHELQPMISSIVENSNGLYASSKDFLWQLNHNSDDPNELFDYLTAYGQQYYNQFDIAFSASAPECHGVQLDISAALNLIFIFKEAMTNVAKHSGAGEAVLTMICTASQATFILQDNGCWKEADTSREHYGLGNMERRCRKQNFNYQITKKASGTRVAISVPVHLPISI